MATFFKRNDTWPPLRGRAEDENGIAMDLTVADSLKVLIKSTGTLIQGTATPIDPPDSEGMNWQYIWDDDDLDISDAYAVELEITWDSGTSPPRVETVPSDSYASLTIKDDLG